jgi:hypothetical protein
MREQLSAPATVGALFRSPDELAAATLQALALRPALVPALAAHRQARDARALARRLDGFVAEVLGARSAGRGRR